MELKYLIALEKWTALLALIVMGVGILALSPHAALSVTLGAGLMAANAWAIRRSSQKLGAVLTQRPGFTVLLFNLKMGALAALVWIFIRYLRVDPVWFFIGVSVLPAAIVIVALKNARTRDDKEPHG